MFLKAHETPPPMSDGVQLQAVTGKVDSGHDEGCSRGHYYPYIIILD